MWGSATAAGAGPARPVPRPWSGRWRRGVPSPSAARRSVAPEARSESATDRAGRAGGKQHGISASKRGELLLIERHRHRTVKRRHLHLGAPRCKLLRQERATALGLHDHRARGHELRGIKGLQHALTHRPLGEQTATDHGEPAPRRCPGQIATSVVPARARASPPAARSASQCASAAAGLLTASRSTLQRGQRRTVPSIAIEASSIAVAPGRAAARPGPRRGLLRA